VDEPFEAKKIILVMDNLNALPSLYEAFDQEADMTESFTPNMKLAQYGRVS
jgi:hypothetical protein